MCRACSGHGKLSSCMKVSPVDGMVLSQAASKRPISYRLSLPTVPPEFAIPEVASIDTERCYWSALHGGGKLRRFHPDGSIDRDIDLPVSQPTMPAFAGEGLATLYVTSASHQMSAEAKAKEPHAGGLFRLDAGRRGIARPVLVR